MKIIGITGSIGCGKTYLSDILRDMGYCVYNPDLWVHNLYKKSEFLKIIKENFSMCFDFNGKFDKRSLRNIVFNNKEQLKKLESIIHPILKNKLKNLIRKSVKKEDFLFLDVALLLEMKWDKYCDFIILADVDEEIQIRRVMNRDKVKREEEKKIIAVQEDKKTKYKAADYIIDTGYSDGINRVQLIKILQEIK